MSTSPIPRPPENRGPRTLSPSSRQVAVARAYVEGLEVDRQRLQSTDEKLQQTVWEAIQLASYNRAITLAVHLLLRAMETGRLTEGELARIEDLLDDNKKLGERIWECACGHSKYDHDENGCLYLGCRPICGVS